MPSVSSSVDVFHRASDLPMAVLQALENVATSANIMLPTFYKCLDSEKAGQSPPGHLWVVIYSRPGKVALVLSCTDGYMGAYPIFIINTNPIDNDDLATYIRLSALTLQRHVAIERVYSVFAPIRITELFTKIWTQLTGVQAETHPYYDAKISCLRWHEGLEQPVIPSGSSMFEVGLATQADILAVAKLCHAFAIDSVSGRLLPLPINQVLNICSQPPFTLTEEAAFVEAKKLVSSKQVWVHKVNGVVVSIAAFTRNTSKVATITKVRVPA